MNKATSNNNHDIILCVHFEWPVTRYDSPSRSVSSTHFITQWSCAFLVQSCILPNKNYLFIFYIAFTPNRYANNYRTSRCPATSNCFDHDLFWSSKFSRHWNNRILVTFFHSWHDLSFKNSRSLLFITQVLRNTEIGPMQYGMQWQQLLLMLG